MNSYRRILAVVGAIVMLAGMNATAKNVYWNVTNGVWDTTTANWTNSTGWVTYADGDNAFFAGTSGGTVTVASAVSPGTTTVSAASGTYTFTGSGIVAGKLVLDSPSTGSLVLNNTNTPTSVSVNSGHFNSTFKLNSETAVGSAPITFLGNTQFGVNALPNSVFGNNITVAGNNASFGTYMPLTYTGTLTVNNGQTLNIYFYDAGLTGNKINTIVALTTPAAGSGSIYVSDQTLGISNMNQLPSGNLSMSAAADGGACLVLDNISWSSFLAKYPTYGTGAGQMQGACFGARGQKLLIDTEPGGLSAGTFLDRDWSFGSPALRDGLPYGDKDVEARVNTTLSAKRTFAVKSYGPGTKYAQAYGSRAIISGNIGGAGVPVVTIVGLYQSAMTAIAGELVLSGTNNWTGSAGQYGNNWPSDSGYINTGRGGMVATCGNYGFTWGPLVRFVGNSSLPTGAQTVGLPAYLAAYAGVRENGFLLTGDADGETYELPSQYKFLLFGGAVLGSSGEPGSSATLRNSAVLVYNSCQFLVRDGAFTLGEAGSPVLFQPGWGLEAAASGLTAAATVVTNAPGVRNFYKRGTGTLILGNVAYTQVDGTGDTTNQFTYMTIGRGTAGNNGAAAYFDGAVRSLADSDPLAGSSNSLKNFNISLNGGVLEIDGRGSSRTFARTLGYTPLYMGGNGGGGFAAYNGALAVSLSGGGTLTWIGGGQFIPAGDPLLFGSQTANDTVTLSNPIALAGAVREIRVVDNTNTNTDLAVMAGALSGTGISGINKTGDGTLVLAAATNTYAGATTVSAGRLEVNGTLDTQSSTVTVYAAATLGGTGTISRTVNVASNGVLTAGALGATGTLTVTNLMLDPGAVLAIDASATGADRIVVTGTATVPTNAVVNLTEIGGASLARNLVIISAGTLNAPSSLSAWSVPRGLRVQVINQTVVLGPKARGTVFVVR